MMLNYNMTGFTVTANFVLSDEFQNLRLSDTDYVRYMYRGMMGREADPGGLQFWVAEIGRYPTREQGRWAVFAGFAYSEEFAKICASFGINPI